MNPLINRSDKDNLQKVYDAIDFLQSDAGKQAIQRTCAHIGVIMYRLRHAYIVYKRLLEK